MSKEKGINNEKITDLSFFMPSKVEVTEEVEAIISTRFKDDEGNVIPFRFKPITTERVDELEKLATEPVIKNNRKVGERVNQARFMAHIAVETTVYPNFKAEELRKAYKSEDPIDIAKRVLNVAGEYANWIAKCAEINGFDDDIEDLEEIAKNS